MDNLESLTEKDPVEYSEYQVTIVTNYFCNTHPTAQVRHAMSDYIRSIATISLSPQTGQPILDLRGEALSLKIGFYTVYIAPQFRGLLPNTVCAA